MLAFRNYGRTRLSSFIAVTLLAAPYSALAGQAITSGLENGTPYDGFIVKYRTGSPERANVAEARSMLAQAGQGAIGPQALALNHARRLAIGADWFRASRKLNPAQAEALMRKIAADPDVEYVQLNTRMYPVLTPNDTHYARQWAFSGANGIRAERAWDRATGRGVVVAVLDTGITDHADLNPNVLPGYDFVSDAANARDGDGRDDDPADQGDWNDEFECDQPGYDARARNSSWHGTHVAGTVAASTNNAVGVAGTAFNASIVPVRVLAKCGGTLADIADAIAWASGGAVAGIPANANPAEVINMSLGGGGGCSRVYQDAIDAAVARGTTVVAAAGNYSMDVADFQPASCANVIAVASTDSDGNASWFSNFGAGIDIAAPGGDVISTYNSGRTVPGAAAYSAMSGTSMAAPHVAGVVALAQSVAAVPQTPAQMEALITANATPFAAPQDQAVGAGILNAQAVVDAVAPRQGWYLYRNTLVTLSQAGQAQCVTPRGNATGCRQLDRTDRAYLLQLAAEANANGSLLTCGSPVYDATWGAVPSDPTHWCNAFPRERPALRAL
ncbi:S8 family peptidase [Lysobacter sp. BMK333-48F3]|uniref:S8 family peptidase n=1 Tax=Lysobacter sp. BMK333-48F3 TaxID=2867962 RepID=UPI001C8B3149|nr:S8 family peptidase [Lysobacter sp. BMK333-48F3]MBX9400898.1 S8 family peptidase [Lysobacter sp. BMK333-48F3]